MYGASVERARALGAVEPLVVTYIFDSLGAQDATASFTYGLIMLAARALGREVLGWFNSWLSWRMRLRLQFTLLEQSVHKLHRLRLDAHRSEGVGAIITRLDRAPRVRWGAVATHGQRAADAALSGACGGVHVPPRLATHAHRDPSRTVTRPHCVTSRTNANRT